VGGVELHRRRRDCRACLMPPLPHYAIASIRCLPLPLSTQCGVPPVCLSTTSSLFGRRKDYVTSSSTSLQAQGGGRERRAVCDK